MSSLVLAMILSSGAVGPAVVRNDDTGETFAGLTQAIDDTDTLDGHTLSMLVSDHTTPETQITFSKSLTLSGAGGTLRPSTDTGTSGDARGWFLVDSGKDVTFEDLVLDGSGVKVWNAIRSHGTLTVDDCEFTQIQFNASGPHYAGVAVATFMSTGLLTVVDCTFSEIGRIGLHVFGDTVIERCDYTGKGTGDFLDYFVCVGSFGTSIGDAVITDCTVSDNLGVASVDGSISAGMLVSTFFGAGTQATITDCTITDNTVGVVVGFSAADTSTVDISNSQIFGNKFGVVSTSDNTTTTAVDNWWGDTSGPLDSSGSNEADSPTCFSSSFAPAADVRNSDGLGDSASNGNVDYCPWILDCNGNSVPDTVDISTGASGDCNTDGVPDDCEITADPSIDCNTNGVLDVCDVADTDCNGNGIPDDCDIGSASFDCDSNGIPDECDFARGGTDCNTNGILDACDIILGISEDCDFNGLPDECDPDCDTDGIPDGCDVEDDCDGDGIPDACDDEPDCDVDGIPDDCEGEPDCNSNGIPDSCDPDCDSDGTPDACETDCDGDGVPDECDVELDCDANGIPDNCDISGGAFDCNVNGVPDVCELIANDCDGNGVPDECDPDCDVDDTPDACEADCDSDGIPDDCEDDCDADGTPDECDSEPDCDGNGTLDNCDIAAGAADCDSNGVPDICDVDCNSNGSPDACDITGDPMLDCDGNGVPDSCEIAGDVDCNMNGVLDTCDPDCNGNGTPDDCDLASATSLDCNSNLEPDECDIADGTAMDCNQNGVPDACDISDGTSLDLNENGIPDDCKPDCNGNGIPDFLDIIFHVSPDIDGDGIPDECVIGVMECFGASCPCGNDDPEGGCVNSTGSGAVLDGFGGRSFVDDDLVLEASGFGPLNSGLFLLGATLDAPLETGDGLRCVGGLFRFMPSTADSTGVLRLTNPIANSMGLIAAPGQTVYFQAWARDVLCDLPDPCVTPCGGGSNLSNALSVFYLP